MLSSKIRHPPAPDVIADRADSVSEEEGGSTYVVDFCGKPGKDGAQGADGLNPSDPDGRPGEDGEDASPAQDCVILLNKIRSSPGEIEGSVMKTLEFFAQGESREHPLSEHEVVYVDAKGAKGGNGGQGGNGLQGKIGEPGDVGRPGHPGEEGGVGGDGENGGRGGNGGNGGNAGRASCGGNVTIQAFDPTLFGLVEVNARGGAGSEGGLPGTPGQGGKGGRGGSGGRSGVVARRSLWCGGAVAERGSRGHDGLDGEDGVAGFPGKSSHHAPSHGVRFQHITGVPERFDVVREGKDRFQPQIYEFTLCDPDEDGIFTPESYAIVKDILVANVGGMPSPEGLQLWTHVSIEDKSEQAPAKLEATFVGAKGGGSKERAKHDVPVIKAEHIHIPEIQPGECRLIPGQLRIQLPPMRDVIRNEVYFSDVAVSIGVDVLGRCLPGSELKQTVAMRWPVEIDNVVAPKFAICDHIAQLQVSIRNYSNKPYGAGTDSGSLRLDVRSLNPAAIAVNGKEFDSSDIEDLPGHRTHTINIDISTLPDSHTLVLTDAVLVYELFFNDRMIAQHDLTTKVLPAMSEQFTDVALVVHPEMDLADLYAWRLLCASLSLSVNLWSVELYGHLLGQVNIGWGNKCQALIVPTPVPLPNIVSQDDLLDMAKANRSFIAVGDIPGQYCLDHALLNYNPVLREAGADYFNGYPAGLERLNSNHQIGRQVERIRAKFDAQLPTCLHVAAVQTFPNHPVLLERQQGILSIYQAMVPRSAQFYAIHTEGKLLSSLLGQRKHVEIPNIGTLDQKWCRTPMEFEIVVELFSHLGSIVFAILQTIDIDKLSHLAMRAFRPLRWEANGVPIPAEHVIYAVLSNRMAREWDWGSWEFPLALSLESQVRDRPLEVPSLLFASVLKNALTKIRVPFVEKLIPSKTKHRYAVLKDIYERMLESMLKASDTDHQDVDREVMGFLNKTELVHGWPSADISSVTDRSQDVVLFDDDLLKLVRDRELSRAGIRRSLKLADVFNPGTQTWQAPDFIKKMDTTSDFEGVVNSIPFNQDKIADQGDKLPNKISEDTKEGAVSKKEEPVIKDKKQEPTSKEKFKEPGIKERMEEPATEESMEAPAIKEKMEKPAIEERMEEPVIKGRMEDPAIKGRMEKPAFEERMEGPAIKGRMEDPAIKERMEKPAFEERMEGPAIKGRMEDPAIKERMEKPAFEERMEGPAITGSKGHLKDEPAYQNKKDEPVYQDKKDEPEYQDKKDQPGVKLPIEVTLPKESTNLEGRLPVIRPPE